MFELPPIDPTTEVVITSDYVRGGVSLTNGNTAYQGFVTLDAGYVYVRAGATVADFDGVYDADSELLLAVGKKTTVAGFNVDMFASYANYQGIVAGTDNDRIDFRVAASRTYENVTTTVSLRYNPVDVGTRGASTLINSDFAMPVGQGAKVNGGVGRAFTDAGDYTIWNAGVTKNVTETVALDVRYYDGNGEDRFGTAFGDRFVVSLRTSF